MRLQSSACALVLGLAALACTQAAHADGGRLRFRKRAGPFIVTLFTTPDPLTRGRADFSVAVERADQSGLVEDADVTFILQTADRRSHPLVLHASHAEATSKWLEAANFQIPDRGLWQVTVVVRRGNQVGQCSGTVPVGAAGPRDLLWDVLPVPLVGLFLLVHWRRKRRYLRDRHNRLAASAT